MQEITNEKPTPDNLKSDFELFQTKLKSLPDNLKPKYDEVKKQLDGELALKKIQSDPAKTDEFYRLFAEFTESSNFVKMLYQVLLEEYFHLGVFSFLEYKEIKSAAVEKIEKLIRSGDWFGKEKSEHRAGFRFKMLEMIRRRVHLESVKRAKNGDRFAALCFSGGGIRSATFGLGILQGLAKHNLLSKFEYISTVSGGGYIGSWLSAWIHRTNNPKEQCLKETPAENADSTLSVDGEASKIAFSNRDAKMVEKRLVEQSADLPEPPEITHLRSYSNYMSPRTGLFSTDSWTLIAVYLRNLLLNWTVFIPFIAAFLLLPKIYVTVLDSNFSLEWQIALLTTAVVFGVGAVVNINAMRPSWQKYSWVDQRYKEDDIGIIKSVEAKIFRWVVLWILILAFGFTTFWGWSGGNFRFPFSSWFAGLFGTNKLLLLYCILFNEILFLGGYFLAWILMFPKYLSVRKKEKEAAEIRTEAISKTSLWNKLKHIYTVYFSETITSIVTAAVSGALLYLLFENISTLSGWFYRVFEKKSASEVPAEFLVCFGVPLFLIIFLLSATLFVGLAVRFTNDEDREWVSRLGAIILMFTLAWCLISTAVIYGPQILNRNWSGIISTVVGGISGLITLILGFSSKSPAKIEGEPKKKKSFAAWFAPAIAAPLFVLFLVILISFLTDILIENVEIISRFRHVTWFVILASIGALMGVFININKFSIHSIYRERLIRAYLGASRTKKRLFTANSFTGLDSEHDNVEMRCLRQKPFHVVNMTLNLVKTHNLRWQNRKAESFTATALYCGSSNMGEGSGNYRSSEDYGLNSQNGRAITLGTAAAISGAAASPNMGYYTVNSAVSILMVLFNVRLGWWLGNPGRRGANTYNLAAPRWSPRLFLDESIGGTDDSKPYVYLSDGGHFDNLGLYEMVLRRCHLIVVSDAACDADFEFSDFGTAIHKIRVDMGIPIEFERDKHPAKNRNCGIGKIRYSCVDGKEAEDGILIYIKPTLDGDEPIDLKNYKKENPDFPHESTADQMYSETQFESYRSLGFHQINSICCRQEECGCQNLSHFERNAERYLSMFQQKEKRKTRRIL